MPTVAAVNGPAIAGGFDVAVMCDLRVVAESATFAHPEIAFGDVVYGPLHDLRGRRRRPGPVPHRRGASTPPRPTASACVTRLGAGPCRR